MYQVDFEFEARSYHAYVYLLHVDGRVECKVLMFKNKKPEILNLGIDTGEFLAGNNSWYNISGYGTQAFVFAVGKSIYESGVLNERVHSSERSIPLR